MSKSNVGFILCLISGILQILFYGFGLMFISLVLKGPYFVMLFALWFLITGVLTIIAGIKMNSENSAQVKKWGIIAIILSILSGLSILTLIGGIFGIVQSKN